MGPLPNSKSFKVKNGKRKTELLQRIALLLMAMVLPWSASAQSKRNTDFGAIVGMECSVEPWEDIELEVEEELRFENYGGAHLER